MAGWIKLQREIRQWKYYTDLATKSLFIHLLISAAYEDYKIGEVTVHTGSYITSIRQLEKETGLSMQNIRTSIKKLEKNNDITITKIKNKSLITITKYTGYQQEKTSASKQYDMKKYNTLTEKYKKEHNVTDIPLKTLKDIFQQCTYN